MRPQGKSLAPFSAAFLSAVAMSTGQASAQSGTVIYDNLGAGGALNSAGASPASQFDAAFPFDAGAADDFVLAASPLCRWSVSGVRWTLKHWGIDGPSPIGSFRIVFWEDADSLPKSGLATIPDVGQALASFTVTAGGGLTPNAGAPNAFDFEATLPQSLDLMPGTRYWIQIQAIQPYPPQWGMHITNARQGLGPVQYFDLLVMPAWMNVPDNGDLAFQLLGSAFSGNCDDGNACTVDTCVAGVCQSSPLVCNDNSVCTTDSCNPASGCSFQPIACNDQNLCTADSCNPVTGCQFTAVVCDDQDLCTNDSCNPQQGCSHAAVSCADSDPCTIDICDGGSCQHFGPPDFDGDGDVDLVDFEALASCSMGTESRGAGFCECADLDGSGQVDMKDMAQFQRSHTDSR